MTKLSVMIKASYLQIRIYLISLLALAAVGVVSNVITALSVGVKDNTTVSMGNLISIILLIVGSVLPIAFFKRVMNFGASRREYYRGLVVIYALWAAMFAVINIVCLLLERIWHPGYAAIYNILHVFHWDQFGVAGMFVYAFGAFMLLLSLVNLLFSGLRHVGGWVIWAVLAAAIPICTAVPAFRPNTSDFFQTLLFNHCLIAGFGLTVILSAVFLLGGWSFTKRRVV